MRLMIYNMFSKLWDSLLFVGTWGCTSGGLVVILIPRTLFRPSSPLSILVLPIPGIMMRMLGSDLPADRKRRRGWVGLLSYLIATATSGSGSTIFTGVGGCCSCVPSTAEPVEQVRRE